MNPNGTPRNLKPFQPGQSGNPSGKPWRARNRITGAFLNALADDFETHGKGAIVECRTNDPGRYLAIVARLVPDQIELSRNRDDPRELTNEELHDVIAENLSGTELRAMVTWEEHCIAAPDPQAERARLLETFAPPRDPTSDTALRSPDRGD